MQIVAGSGGDTMSTRDILKQVPTRLMRFVLRVAQLQPGRYMIMYVVGDEQVEWSVTRIEKVER